MQKYNPIYIYTQSLDNTSEDLMYQILHDGDAVVSRITDLATAQNIMSSMHTVALDKNLKNYFADSTAKFLKEYIKKEKDFLIYSKGSQVLIKLKTDDKDDLDRHSPIHILLDLPDFSHTTTTEYANFFYNGFIEFCHQTGRQPKNLELLRTLPFIYPLEESQKISSRKAVVYAVGVIFALLVFFILKSCTS